MEPMTIAKSTLFVVVLLIAFATSKPHKRSHGYSRRHSNFEWNSRKIGTKKVATISIRKDEERDRRSVALSDTDADTTYGSSLSSSQTQHQIHHHHELERQHAHQLHQSQGTDISHGDWVGSKRIEPHNHRHRHGQEDTWIPLGEVRGGREWEEEEIFPSRISLLPDPLRGRHINLTGEHYPIGMRLGIETSDTNPSRDILSSASINIEEEFLKDFSASVERHKRKNGRKKTGKKKKRSQKVKREKKRRRNKGKKKKNRGRKRRCKHLKGKEKKKCRAMVHAPPPQSPPQTTTTTTEAPRIIMKGDEACQYHNLEECSRKVGFLALDPEDLRTVVKCRYREEFFDCMEEQRLETCDPSFRTDGDMKGLRQKIREAITTTNSCIISEVVQG